MKSVVKALAYVVAVASLGALAVAGCFASPRANPIAERSARFDGGVFDSSRTERLVGTAKVKCHQQGHYGGYVANFTASGTAKGPYPGTFTAEGGWVRLCSSTLCVGFFAGESFTITSGSRTIQGSMERQPPFGSCTSFGPVEGFFYTLSGSRERKATIEVIEQGNFGETLYGF